MSAPLTLGAWRAHVAGLTAQEAANAAGIPLLHASRIEATPLRATLGALRAYVGACGGTLNVVLSIDDDERRLAL